MAVKTIWKYPLPLPRFTGDGRTVVSMPEGYKILTFQTQGEYELVPTLWAEINPMAERVDVTFWLVGTGFDVPAGVVRYVGTVQTGSFVWHLYEEILGENPSGTT